MNFRVKICDLVGLAGNVGLIGIALYQMLLRDVLGISSAILYISSVLCIITVLYAIFFKSFNIFHYKEYTLLLVFHIYMLFAGLFSPNISSSFYYWRDYSMDYIVMFCLIAIMGMKKNIKFSISIISIGALIMVAIMLFVPSMRYGSVRFRLSADSNPNALGLIIAFGIWMATYLSKFRISSFVAISISSILSAIAIIMTGSRKALILLLVIYMFYLINYFFNSNIKTKTIILLLAVLLGGYIISTLTEYFLSFSIAERFANSFSSSTDVVRFEMYRQSIEAFKHNPLFGYGYMGYRHYYGVMSYSHSNFSEVLVNGGIIGTGIYWSAFIILIIKILKTRKRINKLIALRGVTPDLRQFKFQIDMVFVITISIIALSLTLIFIYSTIYQMYIWIAIACANIVGENVKELGG